MAAYWAGRAEKEATAWSGPDPRRMLLENFLGA